MPISKHHYFHHMIDEGPSFDCGFVARNSVNIPFRNGTVSISFSPRPLSAILSHSPDLERISGFRMVAVELKRQLCQRDLPASYVSV